jgi:peptide/nickel transport system permease protein
MLRYVLNRLILFIPTLFVVSLTVFFVIQLPPGDYVTSIIVQLEQSGEDVDQALLTSLRKRYGLDEPMYVRYFRWIKNIVLKGNFGYSLAYRRPVGELIWERLLWTFIISLGSIIIIWLIAFPVGVYSATHQYSLLDYVFTFFGFVGRGVPNFMIALILMWLGFAWLGWDIGGLFSQELRDAPWGVKKFVDLLKHIWVPLVVLSMSGTAGLIRTMRANLLDELHKPYVISARARGLSERKVIWKYPVRVALIPFISSVGQTLPRLISGATIISVVLSLPTTGPLMLRALLSQDMYLAGSFLLLLSTLTITGTFVSDILLAWVDPRIRMGK